MSAPLSKHLPKSRTAAVTIAASSIGTNQQYTRPQLCLSTRPSSTTAATTTTTTTTTKTYPAYTSNNCNCARNIVPQINHIFHRQLTTLGDAAKMSTMPAQHGHSEACCNIPPIVSKGYDAKGGYEELGGYKTYVTGPSDTTKGLITIYDIFGYYPQTLQGADIIALSGTTKYKVFIPDWFKGEPASLEWFPPTTEEKQKKLGAFFQKYPPPSIAGEVSGYVKALSAKYPEIKEWAILGFCWGGKVVSIATASPENPFKAGIEAHPAMVDPKDAEGIKIPLALLASKDENPEDVKKFEANLTGPKHVETFGDQIHGWMAARSDLEDERVKSEYKRGYQTVLKFLSEHL
ncbi:alpha/beta-hydrolase [Nemania sp. FL0031]|nr:alpha/beta-hydrolase [Nemania sp. FL0031]